MYTPSGGFAPAATRWDGRGGIDRELVARYEDPISGYTFVVATPAAQPALWLAYLAGAVASYSRHDVAAVLEYDQVADGSSTAMFFCATDDTGAVVGGMRVQGPYASPDHAHALQEWAGREGAAALHAEINARLPGGVIEMKTGWVEDTAAHRRDLTDALARIFVHALRLTGARYALGTVAQHAVRRWQTTGGVISQGVHPVAYPDDRYLTVPMWWDRDTYAQLAIADQLPRLLDESAQLDRSRIHLEAISSR